MLVKMVQNVGKNGKSVGKNGKSVVKMLGGNETKMLGGNGKNVVKMVKVLVRDMVKCVVKMW